MEFVKLPRRKEISPLIKDATLLFTPVVAFFAVQEFLACFNLEDFFYVIVLY